MKGQCMAGGYVVLPAKRHQDGDIAPTEATAVIRVHCQLQNVSYSERMGFHHWQDFSIQRPLLAYAHEKRIWS